MSTTSIVIADDHPLILKGLNSFLEENNFNVIAKAKDGKEALTLIKAHRPNIAVLDLQMPKLTGLEVAESIFIQNLETKVIIITFEKSEKIYNDALALGNVYGYILKEFAIEEIKTCIAQLQDGKKYYSPELLNYLESKQTPKVLKSLTKTEMKILKLVMENKTAKEIGSILFISDRTVEKHKSNIRSKLKLPSKGQSMAVFAKEHEAYLTKYT